MPSMNKLEEYAYMTELVMETYGVERDEAEQELLTGYGIAKPENADLADPKVTPTERDKIESMLGIEDGWSAL